METQIQKLNENIEQTKNENKEMLKLIEQFEK